MRWRDVIYDLWMLVLFVVVFVPSSALGMFLVMLAERKLRFEPMPDTLLRLVGVLIGGLCVMTVFRFVPTPKRRK